MSSTTMDDGAVTSSTGAPSTSEGVAAGVAAGVAVNLTGEAGQKHEFDSSFLQHASGQGIAGIFAWAAICVTCHQVRMKISFSSFAHKKRKPDPNSLKEICLKNSVFLKKKVHY